MVSPARPKEFENLITRKYLSLLSPWSWTFMNTRDHSRIFRILEFFAEFLKSFSSLILQWLYNSWNDHLEVKISNFVVKFSNFESKIRFQVKSWDFRDCFACFLIRKFKPVKTAVWIEPWVSSKLVTWVCDKASDRFYWRTNSIFNSITIIYQHKIMFIVMNKHLNTV